MNLRLAARLRPTIIRFAVILLLGCAVLYLSIRTHAAKENRQILAQRAAQEAARDLRATPERLARDKRQAALHAELLASGFIGEEARLDWLGALAQLRIMFGLQQLNWRLLPRAPSELSRGLYKSAMVLELAPIDVPRLEQFLVQLRGRAHGRFTVRECTLRPDVNGSQASVTCTLDWWTWHEG